MSQTIDSTEWTDDEIPGTIVAQSPRAAAIASKVQGTSRVAIFFRCLSCCNCVVVSILVTMILLEINQVQRLQSAVDRNQATMEALRNEVREKQEGQIQELHQEVEQEHDLTFLTLAGIFTVLTCLISMFHISSHLQKMNQPIIQRKIIAILWMSPVYSITSFLSLLYPPMEGYMAIIKDFYESYCIYTFLSFLIVVLGRGSRENAVEVLALRAHHLEKPTRLLSRWYDPPPEASDIAKAHAVITECQIFAMQFVFIRPLTTVVYVIYRALVDSGEAPDGPSSSSGSDRLLRWLQASNETELTTMVPTMTPLISPTMQPITGIFVPTPTPVTMPEQDLTEATKAYFQSFGFVLAMVVNISVLFAFTGLVKFYHSVHNDLAWCRPWPKFLTIKGVVFLTFWQGLAILIFVNITGSSDDAETPTERGHRYQNTLICCEMLLFSLTHWCVFPAEEWEKGYEPKTSNHQPGIGIQDFVSDVGQIYRRRRRRRPGRSTGGKRSSPRHGEFGLYQQPGLTAAYVAEEENGPLEGHPRGPGRRKSQYRSSSRKYQEQESSESYNQDDDDLYLEEDVVVPQPTNVRSHDEFRARAFSDGSSMAADDEEDDMELL